MSPHNDIVEKNFDEKALFCMVKMDMDVWWVHFFGAILPQLNSIDKINRWTFNIVQKIAKIF